MARIAELGHVGFHVFDLALETGFYRDVLGLEITDGSVEDGYVFLSSRPDEEHHELLLTPGRTVEKGQLLLQQVSFRCDSYQDIAEYFKRFNELGVEIDMTVSHGNAVGIYFYDPERNRIEVYWHTGLSAKQGFLEYLDLSLPWKDVMAQVSGTVEKYGKVGYVEKDSRVRMDMAQSK